jgi:hypothetical protein
MSACRAEDHGFESRRDRHLLNLNIGKTMTVFVIKDKTDSEDVRGWPVFRNIGHEARTADEAHEKLRELKEAGQVSRDAIVEMR